MLDRTALLFNGMSQGVVFQDLSGEFVLANPAAERILGLTADELFSRTSCDPRWCAVREDGAAFSGNTHPSMVALRTGQSVCDVVMGIFNPVLQEQRWLRINAVPQFREGETEPFEVFTTFEDITDLKRLEQALRRSEERFRIAAECSDDILYEWHLDTDEVECFGRNRSGLTGAPRETWEARLHPDEREGVMAKIRQRLADGRRFTRELRLRDEANGWMHVMARGQAVLDESGRATRWIGAVSDVTKRREAEASVGEAFNLFESVVEGTSDPVFVKNLEGQYLMVNAAGAARLGRPASEVLGRTNFELLPRQMAESMHASDQQVLTTGEPVTYESEGPGIGKYLTTKMPYRNSDGEIIGLLGIARDVTALKRLEAEYRQAQKMEAVGRLAGGVAHDFNNLLTVILGYIEELQAPGATLDGASLAEVKAAAERATQLTSQLLAFSRRQVLQPQPTDLNTLITNLERMLLRVLREDIRLRTMLAPDAGTARVDRGQFEQVIMNLVVNGRDAMPQGGRLTISTSNLEVTDDMVAPQPAVPAGRYVMVTVADSGEGIAPDVLPRIFEPFYTTKERAGTGLGLSTVYGIVKQSGGDVWVSSEPGVGTTFRIVLPSLEEPAVAPPVAREAESTPGQGVVLLVEDEERLRTLLETVLRRQGYTVHCRGDVPEARAWLADYEGRVDLILTDMVMPNGTGLQLEAIARQAQPDARLLFMSGYAEHAVTDAGELPPGTHFIQKPFTPRALALKIRDILDA